MTFLTMLASRIYNRLSQVRAHGDSGQDLIEYAVTVGALIAAGTGIYLVVCH